MKSMKMKLASFATTALLGLVASNAGAGTQAMPGNSCTLWSGTSGDPYFGNPRLYNMSTTNELTALCSIDADGKPSVSNPEVRVIDNNPIQDVSCTLHVHTLNGAASGSSWGTTSGNSSSVKIISLSSLLLPTAGGLVTFACDIPPRWSGLDSAIVSYKLD